MIDIGQHDSKRASCGRPRKSPEQTQKEKQEQIEIRDQKIQELLDRAVELFKIPYDDRDERPPDAPTISYVAKQLKTSRMRVRKLLVTANFYSSATSRRIAELQSAGADVEEICKITGLGRSANVVNLTI